MLTCLLMVFVAVSIPRLSRHETTVSVDPSAVEARDHDKCPSPGFRGTRPREVLIPRLSRHDRTVSVHPTTVEARDHGKCPSPGCRGTRPLYVSIPRLSRYETTLRKYGTKPSEQYIVTANLLRIGLSRSNGRILRAVLVQSGNSPIDPLIT